MLRKRSSVKFVGAVIALLLLASSLLAVVNVGIVSAAPALSLKWSDPRSVTGAATRVGAQAADLRPDIPGLEVVVTGIDGGIESGLTNGYVTCLNGQTGARIWRVSLGSNAIRNHSPFEIADLDKDGTMEIVVAAWTRTVALNGEDGSVYWNVAAPSYDCWPAIADVNGDGYPEVFVDGGFGPETNADYLTELSYDGRILAQTSSWHPCWGGMAIADANFDGRFEIYQGDRSKNYNPDGPYTGGGKGVRCLDAITLQDIWTTNTLNPEISASSHIPMLADVDKDGVLDVIVGRQSIANGIAVLNASDGSVLTTGGKYRNGGTISQHSQPTICDIDYDGNLEMICGQGTNYVWDLYDWKLDATLPVASGDPPKVADINGDGRLEIIAFDDYYMRSYQVFANGSVVQVDVVGGLSNPNPFTLLADVDADGLNELVVTSTSGNVYCYNALSAVSSPRQSWETGFYSNYRLGVAEYVAPPTIKYPLTVNVVGSGQVTRDPNQPSYEPGTVVTLTANPDPEATFIGWSGDLSGSTNPTTITMDSGKTVTATFTLVDHDDVVFDSSFDMGNLKNVVYQSGDASGNRYYTGEQEHTTVSGMTDKHWWFYFSMDQVDGKTVTIKLVNNEAADFSGNRWNEIEPVYSYDNVNWLRLPLSNVVVDATARTFQMTVPSSLTIGHSKVWLAPLPPYNIAKRDALFTEFASSPYLTVSSLGTTPGGQQLRVATITDSAYSDAGKFRSYVIAQQHAGEIPGSWNAEGLIRFLLSNDPTTVAIRRSYIFKIVPIVNVDGVYQGISRYTGLRSGAQYDLNRDWSSRTQPEIQWIWADMVAFQPDSFNDMHSTINTEVSSPRALLTYTWSTSDPDIIAFRASIKAGGFPETVTGVSGYACSIVHNSFGIDESVSWENPHDEHSAYPGVKLTVNDWMSWGAAWAKGNYLYFGAVQGTVTITIDGGGSVVKSPDKATYDWGTDVQLTANPSAGWTFSGWTGDVSGTANPATLTISGDHSVTAHFIPVGGNAPPIISLPQPADGALDVPISTSNLNFTISDFDGDLMNYTVTTSPNVGTGSATGKADGTYSIPISGLAYSTTYSWTVSVTDGTDTTYATYTFATEALSYDDVIFSSSFDMGNLNNVIFQSGDASGNRYYTGQQEHTTVSFTDKHWWFYFSMDNVDGKTVTIKLVNNEAVDYTGLRWPEIEPVYSFDNVNWERLALSNVVCGDSTTRTFQMTVPSTLTTGHSKIWLAPVPPYNIGKRDSLIAEFASSPYLTVSSLGTTPGGQELKVLTITDPAFPDAGKFKSYVIAQQHVAEVGSWNAEGLVRFLLSNDPQAAAIRRSFIFRIVPIVNVDGVYEGVSRYTPLRSGVQYDLNRWWEAASQSNPNCPVETKWIFADIQTFQPDSFNDFHSTINTEVTSPKEALTYSWTTTDPTVLAFRAKIKLGGYPETVTGTTGGSYCAPQIHSRLGVVPSVSWENPHDELSTNPGVKLTVNDWMSWGAGWAKGNYLYFVGPFNSVPVVSLPNPTDGAVGVPTSTSTLSFTVSDADGDSMDYSVTTSPNVGSGSATGVSDGTYSIPISALASATTYSWTVEVNDGTDLTSATYTFTTEGAIMHTLSITIVGQGQVNLDKVGPYPEGTIVELTAAADLGWSFGEWGGALSGNANPTTITMDGDKSVTATFTQDEYTLTTNTVGSGSVAKSPDQATYHYGDSVTLTATADAGWSFNSATGWSGAGSTDGSGNRVVSVTGDMAVTATFTQDLKMHLPFSDSTVPIPDTSGNGNVGTPYNGVAWQSTYGGVYSFDQTNDYITVADSASLDGRGAWSQLTVEFWVKTDDAAPSAQRILRKGPSTGTGVNSYQVGFQSTGSYLYFDVWAPGSVAGAYYEVQYNTLLTAGTWYHVVCVYEAGFGSKIYVNGVDVAATRVGTTGDPTKNVGGSDGQPLFIGCRWSGAYPTGNVANFFDGNIDDIQIYSVTLSSSVVQQHYDDTKAVHADYALSVSTVGSGSVIKSPDQALYAYGTVVQLTANAASGWTFDSWSGDLSGSLSPDSVTIDGAKSVTATFTENPVTTYTLTVNVAGQGHVDLDPVGGVYDPGTVVQLTAVPDAGWDFIEWSGALTGNTNPIAITMDASKTVTATFADLTPLTIDDNFDSGSIGTYSVAGNEISFNMVLETLIPTGEQYAYWTYFKVTNTMDEEVTFRVTNAAEVPFLASTTGEAQMVYSYDGDTWSRITAHSYASGVYTFTQSFTSNEVYIATFFPFPYAEMQSFVSTVDVSEWVEKTVLGLSEQGRDINLLTITNPSIPIADKTVIYIVGRQHSAETASSYMLRGLINFLISGDAVAQRLRDDFVWYIVPMVNPDGVYLGASRATADLRNANRDWKNTETAEINLVKTHVTSIDTAYGVDFFIDWHSQMDDTTWANFVYSPSGNTFDSIMEAYTDFDIQYPSTAAQGSETDCTAREWISWNIILNPMYVLEPSPHLYTWTEASLEQQGVNVTLAINEYFPIIYTITATAGVGGTIDPSGDVTVAAGGSQSFTITAGGGYEIADVLVDGVSVSAVSVYPFTNVVADHTISASFSPVAVTYTIVASAGAGGSISPSGNVIVSQGADQTFTVTPDAGYHISDVVVDSVSVGTVGSYPFTNVQDDHTIAAIFEADVLVGLLVDGEFDYSHSSQYLRDDGVGQDWYESRNQAETLLTLDTESVGGNDGKKASLKNYGTTSSNVYLTQNFANQTGTFSVQFDIYIDRIQDNANYDRTGHIYIGNDWNANGIPLDTARERFVLLAFYDSSPSTDGDLQLRARTLSTTAQSWSNTSLWPTVASGLSYDTWYTVKVSVNYVAGTYDVTFNGVTTTFSKMDIYNTATDPAISLISFAADSDGRGDFYVDNVSAYVTHTITASASTGGSIEPVGAVVVADGTDQTFIIATDTGYEITEVLVDGIPQVVASTYTFYDVTGDHSISVSFSLIP